MTILRMVSTTLKNMDTRKIWEEVSRVKFGLSWLIEQKRPDLRS